MAAVAGMAGGIEDAGRVDWARKYPPLLTIAIAAAIALIVLPSALNLPQSNPTETLEYAPVPPEDDNTNDQTGNISSLGLGKSAGIGSSAAGGEGGEGDGDGVGGGPGRKKKRVVVPKPPTAAQPISPNFRCVGTPPRQTFDALAPPCVPFFEGDNGCETYGIGVDCEEIRLAIFMDGGVNYISGSGAPSSGRNVAPSDRKIYDLFKTKEENNKANGDPEVNEEHLTLEGFRVWQQYFNERFQTYGRQVHFFVYYADPNDNTPEKRRENAAEVLQKIQPFAVVSFASEGAEDHFLKALARKGVLNFGSFSLRTSAFFEEFPQMVWSYLPSVEQQIENYGSYLCAKVVGKKPVLASAEIQQLNAQAPVVPGGNGGKRKFGLLHTADGTNWPGMVRMGELVEARVESAGCGGGGGDVTVRKFPTCCLAQDNGESPDYAATQMAEFKQANITTILWTGGLNGNYGKAAAAIGYYPEWIIVGDTLLDANYPVILSQNSAAFDGRAIVITPQVLEPALEQQLCFRAYREVNQTTPAADLGYTCEFYYNLFQFFVGVQVAGAYLGPSSIDKGFHAIPQHESGNPQTPACFYLPGDFTCVKDGQAEVWDADGRPPGSNQPGCWRSLEAGQRYHHALKPWPDENINADITGNPDNEPCNGYSSSARFNPT